MPTKLEKELENGLEISIINLVDYLIDDAYERRASDIHIDPLDNSVRVRLRIDGVLQDTNTFPKKIHSEVISRIKILAGLRTDEHQAAQDGRFRRLMENTEPVDIRVSIAPTYWGENSVLRLLTDTAERFTMDNLGFSVKNKEKISGALRRPYGMILATGPTGSGKTTTLYAMIKKLNTKDVSIITIEDPIEYAIEGVEQVQVNPRTGLTFANGLRSFLRQDPNIIMVGEIRDTETAGLAVNAALTGHLLLSTLHTNDATTTLPRLLDMKVEPYLIASTVNLAIGQRLVRRICPHCKAEKEITLSETKSLTDIMPAEFLLSNQTFYYGKGCKKCGQTGFLGRVGLEEVMVMDNNLREAILQKVPVSEMRKIAVAQGMGTMIQDGFEKAAEGITTIEEVLRVLYE
jgi:type IV pilus assembly protein PilB